MKKLSVYILAVFTILAFLISCGDDTPLKVPESPQNGSSDLTASGVKLKAVPINYYDEYMKELFENNSKARSSSEIFYFSFTPQTVTFASSDNSSPLLCKGQASFSNSYSKEDQINFLRDLRETLSTYNLDSKVLIVGNRPSKEYKYSTIYVGGSYYDLGCGLEQGVKGVAVLDKGNILQNDSGFMFTAKGGTLYSYIPTAIDLIFTLLGINRSNTTIYKNMDFSATLGQNNITSMARLLWETEQKSFDLGIFQDELHSILIDGMEIPDGFDNIMSSYTNAISSNSSSARNLASILSTILNGESLSGLLDNIRNKRQSRLPDFSEYLELTAIDNMEELIYVYKNQMNFIENSSFDDTTEQALKAMLVVGFSQKYKNLFQD